VKAATWDEAHQAWDIALEDGARHRSRYLVTAVGPLSAPTLPRVPGVQDFQGEAYHTGLWPKHPVSLAGKRVAAIGTGATGVQAITEIAKSAAHLSLFQRRPNWCTLLHNRPITRAEMAEIHPAQHRGQRRMDPRPFRLRRPPRSPRGRCPPRRRGRVDRFRQEEGRGPARQRG
jgi:cation diffusion facilitator CzcD-associated flavoprotein CzcO